MLGVLKCAFCFFLLGLLVGTILPVSPPSTTQPSLFGTVSGRCPQAHKRPSRHRTPGWGCGSCVCQLSVETAPSL